MFCRICGTEMRDDSPFCTNCGAPMNGAQKATSSAPMQKKSPVVKEKKPIISKNTTVKIGMLLLLAALYIGISLAFLYILKMEDTVLIKTKFDNDVNGSMSLHELLHIMKDGTRIFNPTIISTALAVGTYVFVYSIPVFAGMAFVGGILRKKSSSLHVVFSVMSTISAVVIAIVAPITMRFVPEVKQAAAKQAGVILEDIKGVSFMKLIIFAIVIIGFIILSGIVTATYNKRRGEK